MFTLDDGPPEDQLVGAPRIRRAPPKGALVGYITCERQRGSYTHHFQNRTQPHEKTDCHMCAAGSRLEWHGYLSCYDPKTREEYVIEVTPAPGKVCKSWFRREGPLRGLKFKLFRTVEKSNGRVMIQFEPRSHSDVVLPEPIDLRKYLERLWGTTCIGEALSSEEEQVLNQFHDSPEEVAIKQSRERLAADKVRIDIEKIAREEKAAGERFQAERLRRAHTNGDANQAAGLHPGAESHG